MKRITILSMLCLGLSYQGFSMDKKQVLGYHVDKEKGANKRSNNKPPFIAGSINIIKKSPHEKAIIRSVTPNRLKEKIINERDAFEKRRAITPIEGAYRVTNNNVHAPVDKLSEKRKQKKEQKAKEEKDISPFSSSQSSIRPLNESIKSISMQKQQLKAAEETTGKPKGYRNVIIDPSEIDIDSSEIDDESIVLDNRIHNVQSTHGTRSKNMPKKIKNSNLEKFIKENENVKKYQELAELFKSSFNKVKNSLASLKEELDTTIKGALETNEKKFQVVKEEIDNIELYVLETFKEITDKNNKIKKAPSEDKKQDN